MTLDFPVATEDVTVSVGLDASTWDAYVDAHPEGTGYHKSAWRHVFESLGHETVYFAAHQDGRVAGVLPTVVFTNRLFGRFLVSLPFVNYGGVLADGTATAVALVNASAALARERRLEYVELRHQRRIIPDLPFKQHKVSMRLPLADDETRAWDALDRKVRNQVRKATRSGLTGDHGGVQLIRDFYSVFSHNMRDLGTPVYPRRFFEAVLAQSGPCGRVFVVRHGRECVAAAISCEYRRTIEVPWASSLRSYRPFAPNNLLYWTVMRYAIARRLEILDFGRSTPDEGTFHFKKQWGAIAEPLAWEYWLRDGSRLPDLSPKNPRFQPAIAVWKHLPVPMTIVLGPAIVRHIP